MRMKLPGLLVAITVSVSACATAGSPFDGQHPGSSGGWLGAGLDRSIPNAPLASPYAPSSKHAPSADASFATSVEPGPTPTRDLDLRNHELSRFRPVPPTPSAPAEPPGVLATVGSSLLLVSLGVLYLGGRFKGGGGGGSGGFRIGGSGRASLRVSPSSTGLAVKF